jgi:hypothetical protein
VGHAADVPGIEPDRVDQSQLEKAAVGHRPNHAADVDRVGRLDKYDRQALEPIRRLPCIVGGYEGQGFVATGDRILRLSALEA